MSKPIVTSTYTPTPLSWKGKSDFTFNKSAPTGGLLCGVKLGSDDWTTNGVTSLWLKWCDKTTWTTKTETRLWEDQIGADYGATPSSYPLEFGASDCDTND